MQLDLKYAGYQTFDDLKLYCHCVASAVGILSSHIFGFENIKTLEFSKYLGISFQLVNIIRDVGEDARRNRVYIPEQELQQFGLSAQDILSLKNTEAFQSAFKELMTFQAKRARAYYDKAKAALPACDLYAQRNALIMGEIYFGLLAEIEKTNFSILNQRIKLTPLRKLWITYRTIRELKKSMKTCQIPLLS